MSSVLGSAVEHGHVPTPVEVEVGKFGEEKYMTAPNDETPSATQLPPEGKETTLCKMLDEMPPLTGEDEDDR